MKYLFLKGLFMAEQRNQTPAGDNTQWTTVIRPRTGWFDVDLEELWRYRDLIVMFVKRNFTVMYKQTILGPLWIILNPLITTVLFNVVFGGIAGLSTDLFCLLHQRNRQYLCCQQSGVRQGIFSAAYHTHQSGAYQPDQLLYPVCHVHSVLGLLRRDRVWCTPDSLGVRCAAGSAGSYAAGPGCGYYRFRPDHQVP